MKIVSWNVNGIRAVHRKGLFQPMLEQLKPDIICLQETKAEEHQSEVDLPDYEEYWNSATKKGYSGTAIFSKVTDRRDRNCQSRSIFGPQSAKYVRNALLA